MKIFSFKKLITFKEGGRVVCEDLAKNQTKLCQKTKKHYVLEGFDKQTNWYYRVYWSLDGTFKYVKLQKIQKAKLLLPADIKNICTFEEIITRDGKSLVIETRQREISTERKTKIMPISKCFTSYIGEEECYRAFKYTNAGIRSEGKFLKTHFRYWLHYSR